MMKNHEPKKSDDVNMPIRLSKVMIKIRVMASLTDLKSLYKKLPVFFRYLAVLLLFLLWTFNDNPSKYIYHLLVFVTTIFNKLIYKSSTIMICPQ